MELSAFMTATSYCSMRYMQIQRDSEGVLLFNNSFSHIRFQDLIMATASTETSNDLATTYRALVIDSGPIIRMTGLTSLRGKALAYYTIPAVLQEIRDAKARLHLQTLPFEIHTREPSSEGMQAVIEFSRKTGDFPSLSSVDLQVLALHYDLEKEGCGIDHIRRTPKRKVGVGRVLAMGGSKTEVNEGDKAGGETSEEKLSENVEFFDGADVDIVDDSDEEDDEHEDGNEHQDEHEEEQTPEASKTWAKIVNPAAASSPVTALGTTEVSAQTALDPFGQMDLQDDASGGQFSDAEDDDFDPNSLVVRDTEEESDDDGYADSDLEISDEECDVYILDPEEVEERKREQKSGHQSETPALSLEIERELQSNFPSLLASLHIPCDLDEKESCDLTQAQLAQQKAEALKQQALQPVSNSGKYYNSFRKYHDVLKPKQEKIIDEVDIKEVDVPAAAGATEEDEWQRDTQSRIIGGSGFSGQGIEVEDDGEGWITSTTEIRKMKAVGRLDPTSTPGVLNQKQAKLPGGPPICQRTACATTDFAMQNVILQMNMELLSVDGIKVRRLKSWVSRCGACYTVYSNESNGGVKRLFCSRCGSDMMQRVACSVDAKTGRLRLHLSKKYKTSLRGTKFSLPKPGSNNRFQGDLLLREDQLLMGAWNQKVKKLSGGKSRSSASSIFGSDLAANVGCHAKMVSVDEIRVGFGRRNPNAATGGRERRGKKKKSGDKACGLRRY